MGSVYLATQDNPRRPVAIKLMRWGLASRSASRRFEFESQVLGRLRHPNIAQVHEAGTHDDGTGGVPYFAMEYVPDARSLTTYAREERLGTRERLALFTKICDAVHHGHQKGIIHRDLKPSNVLVDPSGEPKVIDFGVAKATDSDLAITTVRGDLGQLIGTLQYMSPEQCEGDPGDLDTRSDVYGLGVMLYELLCGQLPYDVGRVPFPEAARVIREEAPSKPSTVNRTLRGDVETIALKALEKDRDRRYQSAADLGQDIDRYLRGEAIEAQPPSAVYRVRTFARRHRPLVIGTVVVAAVLMTGIVGTTWGLLAAQSRAGELEQVAAFQAKQLSGIDVVSMGKRLRQDQLEEARAAMERSGLEPAEVDARASSLEKLQAGTNFTNVALHTLYENMFKGALKALDEEFDEQPLLKAQLLHTMAEALVAVGLREAAMPPLVEALDIRRRLLGNDDPLTLNSIERMGELLWMNGEVDKVEPFAREVLDARRRILGDEHPDTLRSIHSMGVLLGRQRRLEESEPYVLEALEGRRRVLGDEHPDTLISRMILGNQRRLQGRFAEAERLHSEVLEIYRRDRGDEDTWTLHATGAMGRTLLEQGKLAKAEPYLREALAVRRRVLGDEHPYTLNSISQMATLLNAQELYDNAEPLAREAVDTGEWVLWPEWRAAEARSLLGEAIAGQGRYEEAERHLLEAEARLDATLWRGGRGWMLPPTYKGLVKLYEAWGKPDKAAEWRAKLEEITNGAAGEESSQAND
jgi:tetratricopeptide (TPR) repeat protein